MVRVKEFWIHQHILTRLPGLSPDQYANLASAIAFLDWKTGNRSNQNLMYSYISDGIIAFTE